MKEIRFFGWLGSHYGVLSKLGDLFDSGAGGVIVTSGEHLVATREGLRHFPSRALPDLPLRKFVSRLLALPAGLRNTVLAFLRPSQAAADVSGDVVEMMDRLTTGDSTTTHLVDGLWHADFPLYGDDVVLMCRGCGYAKPRASGDVAYNGGIPHFNSGREIPPAQPRFLCGRCLRGVRPGRAATRVFS